MESERRSTMSSLKGQLSNVEGSVKSMKAAVVVGSVLTVACLAAVFGVTILANEVSKEVKVSNGTLTAKNGQAVLTTNLRASLKASGDVKSVSLSEDNMVATFAVNAVVTEGTKTTLICDDVVVTQQNGVSNVQLTKDSILSAVLSGDSMEKRSLSWKCIFDDNPIEACVTGVLQDIVFAGYDMVWDYFSENYEEMLEYAASPGAAAGARCGVACGR
ncbi:hypothetical protein HOP50_01g05640 [Chloropicon primus]|uniref:Uncharacterized protein n=1 Tax=Chloropicon primus TaxID=1764295 RepID=A0A5B8MCG3_9CHLO|nr:hypothetical protein A3770_01p05770 [Chloropicon primus]UPQ97273.1 hypothetical protein HOP50_01g05640 [Chloropicon primus]|eukprot:QDZ18059.1 hypothetical protein A3770_01p05770 [Chloropicon primus]